MSEAKVTRGGVQPPPKDAAAEGWRTRPPPRASLGAPSKSARPAAPAGADRHAAITRTLYNYASYKTWVKKVKDTWVPESPPVKVPKT